MSDKATQDQLMSVWSRLDAYLKWLEMHRLGLDPPEVGEYEDLISELETFGHELAKFRVQRHDWYTSSMTGKPEVSPLVIQKRARGLLGYFSLREGERPEKHVPPRIVAFDPGQ